MRLWAAQQRQVKWQQRQRRALPRRAPRRKREVRRQQRQVEWQQRRALPRRAARRRREVCRQRRQWAQQQPPQRAARRQGQQWAEQRQQQQQQQQQQQTPVRDPKGGGTAKWQVEALQLWAAQQWQAEWQQRQQGRALLRWAARQRVLIILNLQLRQPAHRRHWDDNRVCAGVAVRPPCALTWWDVQLQEQQQGLFYLSF